LLERRRSCRVESGKRFATHGNPRLRNPHARSPADRRFERAVPLALARLPSKDDALASILVARLENELRPVTANVLDEIDRAAVTLGPDVAHHSRPGNVPANDRSLVIGEQRRISIVGEHGKERFLLARLAPERVRDADRTRAVRPEERLALHWP